VALAWLASRPGVTAPIVGPRTLAQFEANLAAVEIALSDETVAELDKIFPGPAARRRGLRLVGGERGFQSWRIKR